MVTVSQPKNAQRLLDASEVEEAAERPAETEEFVRPMQQMPRNPIVQQATLIPGKGPKAGLRRAGIGARIWDSGRRMGREWNGRKD
jgi:hypothetical protein